VQGAGCRVQSAGLRVKGFGRRIQKSISRVAGYGAAPRHQWRAA
jgi:hypothetical protein